MLFGNALLFSIIKKYEKNHFSKWRILSKRRPLISSCCIFVIFYPISTCRCFLETSCNFLCTKIMQKFIKPRWRRFPKWLPLNFSRCCIMVNFYPISTCRCFLETSCNALCIKIMQKIKN